GPLHHAVLVRVAQRGRHSAGDLHRGVEWQPSLAPQAIPQRLALHVGHDVVEEARGGAGVVQGQDVRVREAGGDLDLAQETVRAERCREFGPQDLDRDEATVLLVPGEVDRGHPAAAEFTLDRVPPGEGGLQGGQRVGHGRVLKASGAASYGPDTDLPVEPDALRLLRPARRWTK